MTIGETWIFFVPPGWILGGTIMSDDGVVITLRDAVYLEGVASGHALIASIPRATKPADLAKICPTAWGLPDGYFVRKDAILHGGVCKISLRALAGKAAATAIEGVG